MRDFIMAEDSGQWDIIFNGTHVPIRKVTKGKVIKHFPKT